MYIRGGVSSWRDLEKRIKRFGETDFLGGPVPGAA
jgi:hypothetical protein